MGWAFFFGFAIGALVVIAVVLGLIIWSLEVDEREKPEWLQDY